MVRAVAAHPSPSSASRPVCERVARVRSNRARFLAAGIVLYVHTIVRARTHGLAQGSFIQSDGDLVHDLRVVDA